MIYSINYKNLNDLFNKTTKDQLLFNPIFSRKCGKTSSLAELSIENDGYYIGMNREICKIVKRQYPEIKTLSVRQFTNGYAEGLEIGKTLFVDEIDIEVINEIKKYNPHLRIFGFVNNLKVYSFRTILFSEQYLGENESLNSKRNKKFMENKIYEEDILYPFLEHIG
ncbi:hypothetical protein [Staphylococcus equorum]|uniref:Uncharacterized protein n=1 Tax=Staphylococcus equorum TaxID=246432 RepID=A0A9X4LBC5_9STAP|nr:hypothetical protein [Staphylococcus equorum]MDG0860317.1 hypothetical protein [Staphylococcus equorum]